jgi:hypothetical protein
MLRLLVADPLADPDVLDLVEAQRLASQSGVIVRLADALRAYGDELPPQCAAAAAQACTATQRKLELVDRLSDRCIKLGLAHAVLGVAERYPDSAVVTLLVDSPWSPNVDRAILHDLRSRPAKPRRRGARFERRLAGATTHIAEYGIELRLRHGRLGRFGEQARFARLLLQRARIQPVGCTTCSVASPEDYFLLLVTERAYMRPAAHLADFAWAVPALRGPTFDWDYVFATALSLGVTSGAAAYLQYLVGVYGIVSGGRRSLLSAAVRNRFGVLPDDPAAPYPATHVLAHTFVENLRATLEAGRWQSAARLALLPLVAAFAGLQRVL